MPQADATRSPITVLVHSWRTIVVCAVLGAIAGVLLSFAMPRAYTSSVTMQVRIQAAIQQIGTDTAVGQDPNRVVATFSRFAASDDVVNPTARDVGLAPDAVRRQLNVVPTTDSDTFVIFASGASPQSAQQLARAVADHYVSAVRNRETGTAEVGLARLRDAIQQALSESHGTAPGSPEAAAANARLARLGEQRATVEAQIALLENPVSPTLAPDLPSRPSTLSPSRAGVLGGLIGLLLGAVLALILGVLRPPLEQSRESSELDLAEADETRGSRVAQRASLSADT
jgi:uncharacterized protein involved in exopolysaccharide biosynthesis